MQKEEFEVIGEKLVVNAPAKINLYLLIAGRRQDGFHEIDTLMSKITWYDELIIEKSDTEGVSLECAGSYWAPDNDDNLIIKAANALARDYPFWPAVKITLVKNIPAGTGLGSASSDAAATLLGLNKFYGLGLSRSQLASVAAKFGSDTAFFTGGPLAVCTGRGEKLTEITEPMDYKALIIIPPVTIATAEVYKNYAHQSRIYEDAAAKIHPLMQNGKIGKAASLGINMLTDACFSVSGEMRDFYESAQEILGSDTVLSGSGSAMYKLLYDQTRQQIEELTRSAQDRLGCNIILVSNNRW
jgi:4-diphosphocytidyl-2-C-methyl-D-erythritol kinase